MIEELEQLAEKFCIERRLQSFTGAKIELDEVDLDTLSLHGQGRPPISLLDVGVDVMNEVSGSMDGEEASSGSAFAGGFSCNPMHLPPPAREILKRSVKGFLLKVSFLEHHDGVSLPPSPVLNLLAKESDVAEGNGYGLL